jgi:Sec-independent protein translocase protein TatA
MLTRRKSLGDILSGFKKTVTELEKLVDSNANEISANASKIAQLQQTNADLSDETIAADKVKKNLLALLGEPA